MNRIFYIYLILVASVTIKCASVSSTKPAAEFSEDLSVYRNTYDLQESSKVVNVSKPEEKSIVVDFEPQYDITYELDSLLDSVNFYNQKKRYFQGFAIQVYTGTSSEEANEVRRELYSIVPDERSKISYEIPNYKVKFGRYYTRLEAESIFARVKRSFPAAILVPERFLID